MRPVTRQECRWLPDDWPAGKVVFEFSGVTYGCISARGIAVTERQGRPPFYELPENAASWTDPAGPGVLDPAP